MARQMKDSGIEWIGEIPEAWRVSKMKYIGDYVNGYAFKPEQWGNKGKRIIRIQDLTHSSENPNYYDGAIDPKYHVTAGDILVSWAATLDAFIWDREDGWLNQHIFKATPVYAQVCYDFFFWMIKEAMQNMNNDNKHGIMMQHVTLDVFGNFSVPLPSIPEQQRIAAFLDRKCAEIDAVIERTKATIEEYKKLKQAVITEAVTKGVRGPRPMMDSRIEWLDSVPLDWTECRIKNVIFPQEKPITESDEVITCFRDGEVTLRKNRREDGFTISFTEHGYHGVDIGDLVIHGMDAFAGAIGCSDSRGKTTPVVHVCSTAGNNRYFMYFLRSMAYGDILMDLSNGVRIRSSDYRNFAKLGVFGIVVPPIDEQNEIVDFLDKRCVELDTLIAKKTALLTELETYKKSLIYEYVTGKRECPEAVEQATAAGEYPYFPAAVSTKKLRFAQAMMMAKVLDMHGKGMGRVKLEKMLYTIETSIGFDFDTDYVREAAGPLHESIYKCEGIISRQNHWYQLHQSQYGVSYTPTKDAGKYRAYYDKYFSSYNAEIERIINIFKPYSTDQAEIVATLFAAWNDAIIDRKSYTDEDIVDDVLNNWHDNKKRFPKDVWLRAMEQMRKNNLIPKGYGKHTVTKAAEM